MNTKRKAGIGIAMAVLMVFSMAALATAYSGDHQLKVSQQHGMIDGGVIFVTDQSGSLYTCLGTDYEPELSQDLDVVIPEGATVKSATLYNYYTWSRPGPDKYQPGVPANAALTLTDTATGATETKTCLNPPICTDLTNCDSGNCPCPNPISYSNDVVQYWDIKDLTYGTTWRAPGGTFAWDVTGMVTGSGTYTATIANAKEVTNPEERFCTYGFGLLVVYTSPGKPTSTYWIAEGHDILYASSYYGITPEMATTSALFQGAAYPPGLGYEDTAQLCIVSTAINKEKTTKPVVSPPPVLVDTSMVYFNGNAVGTQEVGTVPPEWTLGSRSISVNCYDVSGLVKTSPNGNLVEIQDIKEYFEARNAFLIVNSEIEGIPE
ncbi:MAG: DUF3344 domain-containing protein [bacterium]